MSEPKPTALALGAKRATGTGKKGLLRWIGASALHWRLFGRNSLLHADRTVRPGGCRMKPVRAFVAEIIGQFLDDELRERRCY